MKTHIKLWSCLLLFGLLWNVSAVVAQETLSVSVLNGTEIRCYPDSLVRIEITPNTDFAFTVIFLDWGDGTDPVEILPGDDLILEHEYPIAQFLDDCTYGEGCPSFVNGFCFTIAIEAQYGGATQPENISKRLTFRFPPRPNFSPDESFICVDEEFCFQNFTCPENDESMEFEWAFPDGSTSAEENPCYTFPAAGVFPVTLTASNECGIITTTRNITVNALPIAEAVLDSGSVAFQDDIYSVCLNEGGGIRLNADGSSNSTSYSWTFIPSSGISIEGVDNDTAFVQFTQPGTYQVVLDVNSPCDVPDSDTLQIVVEGGELALNPQDDGCVSLTYTPSPLLTENVVYTINGMEVSTFPQELEPGIYFVELSGANSICQNGVLRDTFLVLTQEVANIQTPDTTICSLDGPFVFAATPENGMWMIDGVPFSGTLNPSSQGAGTFTVTYGNEPCITTDQTEITIVTADITMPPDTELCIDDPPRTFTADPPNGTWSGMGVTSAGVFDPSIGPGMYTLYYDVDNSALPSCSNRDSFIVTVSQLFVDFQVDECNDNTLCFSLTAASSDFTSISWDFDGTGSSSQSAPCHTFPSAGSYNVTVTITRGNCSVTTTETITIEAPPVANFSLDFNNDRCSPLVVSITDNSTGSNIQYQWLLNGTLLSEQADPADLLLEAIGVAETYTLELGVSNDCATDSQIETITVEPLPLSRFGVDQNEYCSGDTILISNVSVGNPDTYAWYLNDELISTDSVEPVISYITEVVDTINICLVTTNSCGADTWCVALEILPTDVTAFFNTDPVVVCAGDSVRFVNFATLGVPVFYEFGDGNSTSNSDPVYVYDAPGEYLVTQQAFGCGFDSFEKLVTVVAPPVASWVNPATGCPGDTLQFINTSQGTMTYAWEFGDGSPISEEESPRHFFDSPGQYQVCLTVSQTSVVECTATLCQTVEISTPPTAGFTFTDSLCLGQTITFNSEAVGNSLLCDYAFGDDNISGDCGPTHVYVSAGDYVVTQIVTDDLGCRDTIAQPLFVRALPEPAFSFMTMDGCFPDSISFVNESILADSYLWDFGDGTTSTTTSPTHVYASPGTYTVTLTAFIDELCSAEISRQVTIAAAPTAIILPLVTPTCAELNLQFENGSTGPYVTQEWDFGDGFVSFEENPSHAFAESGTYTVSLQVATLDDQCVDTTSISITIFPAISGSAAVMDVTCNGGSDGAIDITTGGGTQPFNYNWSNGAETEDQSNLGTGTYELVITDENACRWDTTILLSSPPPIEGEVAISGTTCFGGSDGQLLLNSITGGQATYNWTWSGGGVDSLLGPLAAGEYELVIIDALGCEAMLNYTVPQPEEVFVIDSLSNISCFGENDGVIEIKESGGGTAPYEVFLRGPNYEEGGVSVSRFDSLGPGVYELEISDARGCTVWYDREIIEPAPTALNIEQDSLQLTLGESVTLRTFFNANEPVFTWSITNDLSCTDCPEPTILPTDDRVYILTMVDQNGCVDQDTVVIDLIVKRDIYIPNAFTPNEDGRNDIFLLRTEFPLAVETIISFEIYDRWGGLMFEQQEIDPNDRQVGWDGKAGGKKLAAGVYVYKARVRYVDQIEEVFSGEVLLIR
ncbi:MAG: PKD domain-containing protein [Bacteroidota bacterium]